MTPREIIARHLCTMAAQGWSGISAFERAAYRTTAAGMVQAITSSGYRILGPGEWDKETVEKCAEEIAGINVRNHPRLSPGSEMNAWWSGQEVGHDDAITAIRALAKEKQGC